MLRLFVVLLLVSRVVALEDYDDVVPRIASSLGTIVISTIDGQLRALNTGTGDTRWTIQGDPVLRAPRTVKQGFTFLPNPQDGSLYTLKEGILKRLPLNIPALVHASPLKSTDGVLYAGSKKDIWLEIDPLTGSKVETLSASSDKVCPVKHHNGVFVGRTEYRITMFDTKNRGKTWNTTFSDYSAHLLPANNDYPYRHYVSHGNIVTVGSQGEIIWERDFGQPIVAMYLLQDDGLHKLHFTLMGGETMENMIKSALTPGGKNDLLVDMEASSKTTSPQNALFATLYVGESAFGLYAMDVLVDKHTITYAPKYLGPPLLEGPSPIALSEEEKAKFIPPSRPIITIDVPAITHKTTDGEFLLLGYHERPMVDLGAILPIRFSNTPSFPHIVYKPDDSDSKQVALSRMETLENSLVGMLLEIYIHHPVAFFSALFTLLALAVTVVWMCGKQSGVALVTGEARSAQTSRQSNSATNWVFTRNEEVEDGWMKVGKLLYNPSEILGRGCEGTVVYRGKFDGRDVAVKRVVSEFVRLVDREADLLRESDAHPNVIRYFCMESDSQFRYLALELCVASLNDYVHESAVREKIAIDPTELLHQATEGLAHLHIMQIVHRDMKPQNVLLSTAGARGVRAVISDFGLCKRVQPGRHSLSKRSGLAGTDGWIAPEALTSQSTSFPVDVFSLGCIFYYVLSDGNHPFGDSLHRQTNIINGDYVLREIKEDVNVSVSLIESMIQKVPADRPSIQCVLAHPFFWEPERRLQFFGDVSDRIEKEDDSSTVVRRLERNARTIVEGNWRNNICGPLAADLRKFRTYKGHSVRDLLRAMRNKKHHYRELPEEVRTSLGKIPEEFLYYFTSRFPLLLLHTYIAMEWCADEAIFKGYYPNEIRTRIASMKEEDELLRKMNAENIDSEEWVRGHIVVKSKTSAKA
uniref:non-specific serine/threonine protein kinase n=1 Tax=Haemonchus contortus TaxID=6289 RepID=A0A7I4Y3A0_HAECO